MEWDTYELISNIGDDLKSMAAREDKVLVFSITDNEQRLEAYKALAESGVVDLSALGTAIYVTLLI